MNAPMKLLTLSILLLFWLSISGQIDQNTIAKKYKNLPKGTIVYSFMDSDSVSHTRIELPDSLKKYIVEFTEAPLYVGQGNSTLKSASLINVQLQKIDLQHNQFLNDLSLMTGVPKSNLKSKSLSGANRVGQEFKKVFNGVSLTADKDLLFKIRQLGYVKKVYPDNMVEAIDDESNHVIKADSVRDRYGVTGKGVVIAIIDTGIDSTHQDLSNGKVIGGYDFVNNDDNPMDDHGHGTHCAGIAAAKGPGLTGVAPDAKLLAIKVLNELGNGYESWIIAGIEYAIDPDGDPLTNDGADIISMSLGAPNGNPNDAMSITINNAYKSGVLCVVAAGNNGSNYSTIGTPACAKEALTVGASDKNDYVADFSSRGPTQYTYEIKPNVLAPGVDIYSSLPSGQYASWNGTSMATPHVAGAAALLKEKHPSWNAEKLRSSIIHSATNVHDYTIWLQGNGRVDLMKAINVSSSISKSSINFGLIPDSVTTYSRIDSFYVSNLSGNTLNYQLSIPDQLPSEIELTVTPKRFSLDAADSQLVVLSLEVANKTLAYPSTPVSAYTGKIIVDDQRQKQNLYFSLVKSRCLNITFDFIPTAVLIHNNISDAYLLYPTSEFLSVLLPLGIYDIVLFKNNYFIVRELIDITLNNNLNISLLEAKHKVELKGVDPDNKNLALLDEGGEYFIRKQPDFNGFGIVLTKLVFWDGYTLPPVVKYFSDFSERYLYELCPNVYPHTNEKHQWYRIPFLIDHPITKDTVFCNKPNDFVKFNIHLNSNAASQDSIYYTRIGDYANLYDFWEESANILTPPYSITNYVIPKPFRQYKLDYIFGYDFRYFHNKIHKRTDTLFYQSAYYELFKDSGKVFLAYPKYPNGKVIDKEITIDLNISPDFYRENFYLFQDSRDLKIRKEASHFVDQEHGFRIQKIPFIFSSDSSVILSDTLSNIDTRNWDKFSLPVELNKNHTLKIKDVRYPIYKEIGYSNSSFSFKIDSYQTPFPGCFPLKDFNIFSNGNVTNTIVQNENNSIQFELNTSMNKNVELFFKQQNDSLWTQIYHYHFEDNLYKNRFDVLLPDTLNNSYYSLKLIVNTTDNDTSIHLFEPAFFVLTNLENDSLALVDFYTTTNGNQWANHTNWLKTSLDQWEGITIQNGRVTEIILPDNNLTGYISQRFSDLSGLRRIVLTGNNIETINDLTALTKLTELNLSENKLTFNDIIPNLSIPSFIYSPQQKLLKTNNLIIVEGDPIELNTSLNDPGCHYAWYKNDELIAQSDTAVLRIETATFADTGEYKCVITNSNVPELTLETFPFQLSVYKRLFNDKSNLIDNFNVYSVGSSWIDFDNDNDQDLFVVNYYRPNQLYVNRLNETDTLSFTNVAEEIFGSDISSTVGSVWGDINNDGNIDLFVVNQVWNEANKLYLNNGDRTFSILDDPEIFKQTRRSNSANWVDFNRDGWLDLFIAENWDTYIPYEVGSSLYINQGENSFKADKNANIINVTDIFFTSWYDFDQDFDQDAFTSTLHNQYLLINHENNFVFPENNPIYASFECKTISSGDYDNDGDLDVFIGYSYPYTLEYVENLLLENNNGSFTMYADSNLTADHTNYLGSSWGDYDNDGDLDLLGTSHYGATNLWTNQLQETGVVAFKKINYGITADYISSGRSCSFADYDNDGDLDFFIACRETGNRLFENVIGTDNNWINIKCIGTKSNASAIGAKVKIKATINNRSCWQMREISTMTGGSAQNSLNVSFGLGNASIIDSIQVLWPSGIIWDSTALAINKFIEIFEPLLPNEDPHIIAFSDTLIFEDVRFSKSYKIINHRNKQIKATILKKPYWLNSTLERDSILFTGTPDDFSPGIYDLIVSIDDGYIETPVIDSLKIEVIGVNDAPVITGQKPLSIKENGFLVIKLTDLYVNDVDNAYPDDFSLFIHKGSGYSLVADTLFLIKNNALTVPVQVNDGQVYSNVFNVNVDFISFINDVKIPEWTVYPIPFSDLLYVKVPGSVNITDIGIFDLQGRKVNLEILHTDNYLQIDCTSLTQSIYLMRVTTSDFTSVRKLIKAKQ